MLIHEVPHYGTDVYCLGATLCHAITLQAPWFSLDDMEATINEVVDTALPVNEQHEAKKRKHAKVHRLIKDEVYSEHSCQRS